MTVTDPIADMLTRIRNAIMARHEFVDIPYSNMKYSISKILKDEGYIRNYKIFVDENRKKFLKIYINYDENNNSVITGLKKISKPGRRIYIKSKDIMKVKNNNLGLLIISTSKGLMTDFNARKNNIGGEPLLMVW
ncbi:MAG TPA: 30S ribosomal protein S8 [Syntrophorhabdaceae bacterium]|nr:30S ribosomal protein S8 [Syntrophorhabdaceae bacterium]HPP06780.1 30S ribosomal protein S8 [Syntrophorhabdaceae bacterium]